jgi:predicted ester cyclase
VVAEDDMVVVQYTGRDTNTDSGNGIPITGKRVEVTGVTIFRISDGKIAEEWNESDMLGLMSQLGLLPPMQ